MAMESSKVNNLYITYKSEERVSFESLFPKQDWRGWSLQRLEDETASVVPSLEEKQRDVIIGNFERSSKARKDYSMFFRYAPPQSRWRHDAFVDRLMTLIAILKAEAETPKVAVAQQAETLKHVSVNEAAFLGFLEQIELLVGQAVALWPRAAAGDLRLSTASKRMCCLPFIEVSHDDIQLLILIYSSDEHVPAQNRQYGERRIASEPAMVQVERPSCNVQKRQLSLLERAAKLRRKNQ